MSELQPLLERFLENAYLLSEEELAALARGVQASPDLAERLREQLVVDELLSQGLAPERQFFPSQVEQRVRDLAQGEEELLEQISAMRELAVAQLRKPGGAASSGWRVLAVAAALLLVAGVAGFFWRPLPATIAAIAELDGSASLLRGGIETPLLAGVELRDGDRLVTRPFGQVYLRYTDGTWVRLFGETTARLQRESGAGSKRIFIEEGRLAAGIVPQPAERPMLFISPTATAKVVGTEIWLTVDKQSTELQVTAGKVEFYRANAPQVAIVDSGKIAVASLASLDVKESLWPAERRSLLFSFATANEPALARGDRGGVLHGTRLITRGDTAYNSRGGLALRGGAFLPEDETVNQQVLDGCRETNEITVETVIRAERLDQQGPAQLISYGDEEAPDTFSLGQQGDSLVWRFKTDAQGEREFSLCKLLALKTTHCIVSYRSGLLACYIDGAKVFEDPVVTSGFANWTKQHLTLGAEAGGGRAWHGTLEGVAIYNRFFVEADAQRSAAHFQSEYLPAADSNWKDLLAPVDVKQHAVAGRWTRDGQTLRCDPTEAGRLILPLCPDGSYQVQLEFTRLSGEEPLQLIFPVGQTQALLVIDGPKKVDALGIGLELIDGQTGHESVNLLADPILESGRRYKLAITITTAGARSHVRATLDGQPVLEWSGATRSLSIPPKYTLPNVRHAALISQTGELRFQAARLKMITGQADEFEVP